MDTATKVSLAFIGPFTVLGSYLIRLDSTMPHNVGAILVILSILWALILAYQQPWYKWWPNLCIWGAYKPINEMFNYILTESWYGRYYEGSQTKEWNISNALRQAAHNGTIHFRGRTFDSTGLFDVELEHKVLTDINKDYWLTMTFEIVNCMYPEAHSKAHTQPEHINAPGQIYTDLHVWDGEIKRHWPKCNDSILW